MEGEYGTCAASLRQHCACDSCGELVLTLLLSLLALLSCPGAKMIGKLKQMHVLIVGLRGLGIEVAKNLILAGPHTVMVRYIFYRYISLIRMYLFHTYTLVLRSPRLSPRRPRRCRLTMRRASPRLRMALSPLSPEAALLQAPAARPPSPPPSASRPAAGKKKKRNTSAVGVWFEKAIANALRALGPDHVTDICNFVRGPG
jgi:hypothetical protein